MSATQFTTQEEFTAYLAAQQQTQVNSEPTPSDHPAAKYMRSIFEPGDRVYIFLLHSTDTFEGNDGKPHAKNQSYFLTLDEATDASTIKNLARLNQRGWQIYVCMNPLKEQTGKVLRTKMMVDVVRNVYIDIDEDGPARLNKLIEDAVQEIIPQPHIVLQSSPNKYQIVWLVEGLTNDEQEALNKALQLKYGADPKATDVVRVLRLPGFVNCKPEYGTPAPEVQVIADITSETGDTIRYKLSDFNIDISEMIRKSEPIGEAVGDDKLVEWTDTLEKAMTDAGIDFVSSITNKPGWKYKWNIECPNKSQHTTGGSSADVFLAVDGKLGFSCFHSHCSGHDWKWFRSYLEETIGHKIEFETTGGVLIGGKPAGTAAPASAPSQTFSSIPVDDEDAIVSTTEGLTPEQISYGVEFLPAPVGPEYTEDIFYGPAGRIIKKIEPFNESHPVGMYLNLLVTLGNIFGRGAYFNVGSTPHYTNENLVCVGSSSLARKGTGRNAIKELVKPLDMKWRSVSGFGSIQGLISMIKDASSYQKRNAKLGIHQTIQVPGVNDKRLLIHENEISGLFKLAADQKTKCAEILRNLWDGAAVSNLVAGTDRDGASNSLVCVEPHVSISGDSTPEELRATIPVGSDKNGFGNRFLYCFIYRTKLVPVDGPEVDFTEDIIYLHKVIQFARVKRFMPFTSDALPAWKRWYTKTERGDNRLRGIAGKMTDRGVAHVRRLAMILALIDLKEQIGTEHLDAAIRVWEYCKESAQFIFNDLIRTQERIVEYVAQFPDGVAPRQIREDLFGKHKLATWVKAHCDSLIATQYLVFDGQKLKLGKKRI